MLANKMVTGERVVLGNMLGAGQVSVAMSATQIVLEVELGGCCAGLGGEDRHKSCLLTSSASLSPVVLPVFSCLGGD